MLSKLREQWHAATSSPSPLVRQVRRRRLTYLGYDALSDLERTIRRLDAAGVPGIIVEAGCALGGSTVVLGRAKLPDRKLRVYDVFGMIPPPSDATVRTSTRDTRPSRKVSPRESAETGTTGTRTTCGRRWRTRSAPSVWT
jgi:macrocin-O-methyltransferase TylF-like protien